MALGQHSGTFVLYLRKNTNRIHFQGFPPPIESQLIIRLAKNAKTNA